VPGLLGVLWTCMGGSSNKTTLWTFARPRSVRGDVSTLREMANAKVFGALQHHVRHNTRSFGFLIKLSGCLQKFDRPHILPKSHMQYLLSDIASCCLQNTTPHRTILCMFLFRGRKQNREVSSERPRNQGGGTKWAVLLCFPQDPFV
jgi:hypothetical protein